MDFRSPVGEPLCCRYCGKPLPPTRNRWCFKSRPKRKYDRKDTRYIETRPAYTYADRGAQADARGISYGELMRYVEEGLPLPPLIRSVVWPRGSQHEGEEHI